MDKNFFLPKFFSPFTCKIFARYTKKYDPNGVAFEMYASSETVQYNVANFRVFLPASILANHRFGKIAEDAPKKLIARFLLSEEDLTNLVKDLGGSIKKVNLKSQVPKLGDLLQF